MDLDVTVCAVRVLGVQVMLRPGWFYRAYVVGHAVTSQAKLRHPACRQQSRIRGPVRRVTRNTAFSLHRRVFKRERTLLIRVTLHASRIDARSESGLFKLESAMWVMAVAALHRAFKHLVVKRQIELVLDLCMTAQTKLWLIRI